LLYPPANFLEDHLIPISRPSTRASLALLLLALLSGCAKKPRTSVAEPVPPAENLVAPSRSLPDVSEEELRRQRIMTEAGEVFQTVYFPLDQSSLDAKARTVLSGIHRFKTAHAEVSFTAGGHCDERGTAEYNLALGEQRALAVTRYLASLGVPESRMKSISFGEERPASQGSSESSWSLNRRVEFAPEFRFE
jgi:peptidoglycan-associated lipoprotein